MYAFISIDYMLKENSSIGFAFSIKRIGETAPFPINKTLV